jgi:hypothetical protein
LSVPVGPAIEARERLTVALTLLAFDTIGANNQREQQQKSCEHRLILHMEIASH